MWHNVQIGQKQFWFFGFTAVFAALAAWVFWGAWSTDFAFVAPDAPLMHSPDSLSDWWRNWRSSGKFVPGDLLWNAGSPYLWKELSYALAMYCSGLSVAYFLRGRGLSFLASYGAGLLLGFCGY